jgi:threonine dehydrogenase-like Zn-dependent dehydrogenase
VVVNEIRIQGSRCGPFKKAISWLAQGRVNVDGFVTSEFPLEETEAALQAAAEGGKMLIRPGAK